MISVDWLASFDFQSLFYTGVGVAVSVVTFWLSFKKIAGAVEERVRSINATLMSSCIQRIAVERSILSAEQFYSMRRAAEYRADLPQNCLFDFYQALDSITLDVMENRFLDKDSKQNIIDLLRESRVTGQRHQAVSKVKKSEKLAALFASLALFSAVAGVLTAMISDFTNGRITMNGGVAEMAIASAAIATVIVTIASKVFSGFISNLSRKRFEINFVKQMPTDSEK